MVLMFSKITLSAVLRVDCRGQEWKQGLEVTAMYWKGGGGCLKRRKEGIGQMGHLFGFRSLHMLWCFANSRCSASADEPST